MSHPPKNIDCKGSELCCLGLPLAGKKSVLLGALCLIDNGLRRRMQTGDDVTYSYQHCRLRLSLNSPSFHRVEDGNYSVFEPDLN
mmetsp:Transcript_26585/g.30530  ORF Transcript_26585/g.30530 Transcript_26585/m.30530 type:complete len:85 (-) Transcript_26585:129-383(-)